MKSGKINIALSILFLFIGSILYGSSELSVDKLVDIFSNTEREAIVEQVASLVSYKTNALLPDIAKMESPSLLVDVKVNNITPAASEPVVYNIRYRCASTTEHCFSSVIDLELPAGMEIASTTTVGGNVSQVSQSGNYIKFSLKSPASAEAPSGALAAGSSGRLKVIAKWICTDVAQSPNAGSTVNLVDDVTFSTSSGSQSATNPPDVTVPTFNGCPAPSAQETDWAKQDNTTGEGPVPGGVFRFNVNLPAHVGPVTFTEDLDPKMDIVDWGISGWNLEVLCGGVWYNTGQTHFEAWVDQNVTNGTTSNMVANGTTTGCAAAFVGAGYYIVPSVEKVRLTSPAGNNAAITGDRVLVRVEEDVVPGTDLTNCLSTTLSGYTTPTCKLITVRDPQVALVYGAKSVGSGIGSTAYPSSWPYSLTTVQDKEIDQMVYRLEYIYSRANTAARTGAILVDTLPAGFDFVAGKDFWQSLPTDRSHIDAPDDTWDQPGCYTPTFSKSYTTENRVVLTWKYNDCIFVGGYYEEPKVELVMSCSYVGTAELGSVITNSLSYGFEGILTATVDGDPGQELVTVTRDYTIPANPADVNSSKWVKGKLDTDISRYPQYGNTEISGEGVYEMFIYNTGFNGIDRIDFVDILPHLNDMTLTPRVARGSQWNVELEDAIVIERFDVPTATFINDAAHVAGGVLYANTYNPCYLDGGGSVRGQAGLSEPSAASCSTTDFSTTNSAAGAKGFAFLWADTSDPLKFGEAIKVTIKVRQPDADADANSGEIAWNSFAFTANDAVDGELFSSEPLKVGLQMIDQATTASLGDYVWLDDNANGEQDYWESGIEGVTVSIYEANGSTVMVGSDPLTTITDSIGLYNFYGLSPSTNYIVRLDKTGDHEDSGVLGQYLLSPQDAGGDEDADSDAASSDVASIGTTFPEISANTGAAGSHTPTFDFGYYQPGSICGQVWDDADKEGDREADENTVSNMTVHLLDNNGTILSSTTTNSFGLYTFNPVNPGVYQVQFVAPAGFIFTAQNATGDEGTDSDVDANGLTPQFDLVSGEDPCFQAGIASPPVDPACIEGVVWSELAVKNGVRDGSESFLEGIEVQLLDANGFLLSSTITDSDGAYNFSNLEHSIDYLIQFVPPKVTVVFTSAGSDMDADANGQTSVITPAANSCVSNVDAGLCLPPTIGDLVWKDGNQNGLQDSEEEGLSGITLTLHDMENAGQLVGVAVTDQEGNYLFGGAENENMIGDTMEVAFSTQKFIVSSRNDTEENIGTGANDPWNSDLELGGDGSTAQIVGLYYEDIAIPAGATITSATIQFTADDDNVTGSTENSVASTLSIFAELSASAAEPSNGSSDLSVRTPTTATQSWSPPAWTINGESGAAQLSTSFSGVLQEVIDQAAWNSGNPIMIMFTGSGEREAESYSEIPGSAPTLQVTYTIPVGLDQALLTSNNYEIRIDGSQSALASCALTTSNNGGDSSNDLGTDLNDSDASLTGNTAVIALISPGAGSENLGLDFGYIQESSCSLSISSASSQNCTGSSATGFSAEWRLDFEVVNGPDTDISYQRNSEVVQSHTLSGATGNLTFAGVPADGGAYDTLKVWLTNDLTCADTIFLKRPVPCPADSYSGGGTGTGEICDNVAATEIGGTVYEDWNSDGLMNQSDTIGVAGIQVLAYDCDGNLSGTTYSDALGNYKFTGFSSGESYRVEFFLPKSVSCWAKPTRSGADNGTTVQFVSSGNCANLGVASPSDYCQDNPPVLVACYVNGEAGAGGTSDVVEAFVSFDYKSNGETGSANYTGGPTKMAEMSEIGATWGVAYDRNAQKAYTSAVMKRHCGFGPLGIGGIYLYDFKTGSPQMNGLIDVVNLGVNVGTDTRVPFDGLPMSANELPANANDLNWDVASFAKVGKSSIGGLEISPDNKHLYFINLFENTLVTLDISTATPSLESEVSIPAPSGVSADDFRPWALIMEKGVLYVGGVNTAESSQNQADLRGYVLKFENHKWSTVFDHSLVYSRRDNGGSTGSENCDWEPWTDVVLDKSTTSNFWIYPQPILSDIAFLENGDMVLAYLDRLGMQAGNTNYLPDENSTALIQGISSGDLLRVFNTSSGYQLENAGGITGQFSEFTTGGDGPGGGEFYWGDQYDFQFWSNTGSYATHTEIAFGSAKQLKGYDETMATTMNPTSTVTSGGIVHFNNQTGRRNKYATAQSTADYGYRIYQTLIGDRDTFGKAVGLGELEIACDPAPIEIGNYVWADTDQDGIQDACESGIDGVVISLVKGGSTIATTTTANGGQYYFSSASRIGTGTWSGTGSDTTLQANTAYTISILNASGTSLQGALSTAAVSGLSTENVNSNGNDLIDSDGILNGTRAEVSFTTEVNGCNDHSFDFGFTMCVEPTAITFAQTAPTCSSATSEDDGTLSLTAQTNGTHYGVSTAGAVAYDGPSTIGTATAIPALPVVVQDSIPNAGASYIIRIFNNVDGCYLDTTLTVSPVTCIDSSCDGNVGLNASFETGSYAANASVVDANNAMTSSSFGGLPVDDWIMDRNVFWVDDATKATDGTKFFYLPEGADAGKCVYQRNGITSGPLAPCKTYDVSFDIAGFDENGTESETNYILEFFYWNATRDSEEEYVQDEFTLYGTSTAAPNPISTSSWATPNWTRVTGRITLPAPISASMTQMELAISVNEGGGALIDNICVQEVSSTVDFAATSTDQTCSGTTNDNNGSLQFTSVTAGHKYDFNTTGLADLSSTFAAAPYTITSSTQSIVGSLDSGATYYLRVFESGNCFKDTTIVVGGATCCSEPSGLTFTSNASTCNGATSDDNGSVSLSTNTGGSHFAVGTRGATVYDGATTLAGALPIGSLPQVVQSNVSNLGGSYIVRIFNGADDCFTDETVSIDPVTCATCEITASNLTAINCNNATTGTNAADDYITFDLNPTGTFLDVNYNLVVSAGTISPTTAAYGSATSFQLQAGSAGAGDVTVTLTDDTDPACIIDVLITDPGSCSNDRIDLELSKIADRSIAKIGDDIVFTLEVSNKGNIEATNVVVNDDLPSSVSFQSYTSTSGTYDNVTGEWFLNSVASSESQKLFIVARLTKDTIVCNLAEVIAVDQPDIDSSPNNDDGDQSEDDENKALVYVTPEIDLELTKTSNKSQVGVGDQVVYSIVLTNKGPSVGHNVTVNDLLSNDLTYVSHTSMSDANASAWAYSPGSGEWTIDSVDVGESITLTITTTVSSISGTIVNCAEVTGADEEDIDSNVGNSNLLNEDDSQCVEIIPVQYDIELLKNILKGGNLIGNRTVKLGEEVVYVLRVTNYSSSGLTGVIVEDQLPPGVSFEAANGDGSYDPNTGLWTIGSISPKSQLRMGITVKVTAAGTISNTAEVTSMDQTDIDSIPGNGVEAEDDQHTVTMEVVKPKKKLEIKVGGL